MEPVISGKYPLRDFEKAFADIKAGKPGKMLLIPEAMQLLVIADDFTGALDTGIQFARHGIATTLFLSDALTAGLLADCQTDVVVADTESRHLPPEDAAARVRAVTRLAKAAGCPVFYKKTDSTLRGNLGAELAAMQDVCGAKRLWFSPAYPALGRTTRGGTQLVNGVPLARTDFAADPFNPVRTDFIPALLAEQTDRPVRIAAPAALPPPEADRPGWSFSTPKPTPSCCKPRRRFGRTARRSVLPGAPGLPPPWRQCSTCRAPRKCPSCQTAACCSSAGACIRARSHSAGTLPRTAAIRSFR